jgi:outer membrane autotransporter protein
VTITLTGGAGGDGGNVGTGVAGVDGVDGGAATFTTTAAAIAANVTLNDGEAGSLGTASGAFAGGAVGDGGVANLNITGTTTLTGDITAAADNEGLITTAAGVFTVIGNIGVSGTEVDQITVSGGSSGLTVSGNIFAKDIDIAADDVLLLNGASLQIISAAIESAGTGGDITTGTNAVVRFDGALGKDSNNIAAALDDIVLGTGSTTTFSSTVNADTITTSTTGNTTIEDAIVVANDFNAAAGTTITLGRGIVAGDTAISHGANTGGFVAAGGIAVNMPETFNSGTITLAAENSDATGAAADIARITFGTNFLNTFSAAASANDADILVTAVRKSATTIASALSIRSEEASALDRSVTALATGDAEALTAMENALVSGGLTAKTAAETVGIQADSLGATSFVASAVGGTVMSINTTRLAMLREGTAYAANGVGFAAGSGMMAKNVWLRSFGTTVDQDARGGIAGFDADTFGAVAGLDVALGTNGRIGISGSYASTSIDGDGAGNAQTDIDGWGLNLYGDLSSSNAYIEFLAGYGWNQIASDRTITIGGLQRTALASFDSTQYTIAVGGGAPRPIGGGSFFTPYFSVSHTSTETDNYTETGGGNLNLTVSSADVSATIGTLGVRYHSVIAGGPGRTITPELSVALQYDFSSDEAVATGTFAGGGAAFTTTGAEVEELGINVGAGVSFVSGPGSTVGISYDAVLKSDYVSHTGAAVFRVSF